MASYAQVISPYGGQLTQVVKTFTINGAGPHGTTGRWSYIVPSGQSAWLSLLEVFVYRDGVPTSPGAATAIITLNGLAILYAMVNTSARDVNSHESAAPKILLQTGDTLAASTSDGSAGGSHTFFISATIQQCD